MKLKLSFLVLVCVGSIFYFYSTKRQTSLNDIPSWYVVTKKNLLSNIPYNEKKAIEVRMDEDYKKQLFEKAEDTFNRNFSNTEFEDLNKLLNTEYKKSLVLEYAKAFHLANSVISAHINVLKIRERRFRKNIIKPEMMLRDSLKNQK